MKKRLSLFIVALLPLTWLGCQDKQVASDTDSQDAVTQTVSVETSVAELQQEQEESTDSLLAQFTAGETPEQNEQLAANLLNKSQEDFKASIDSLNKAVAAAKSNEEQQKIFFEGNPIPVFQERMAHLTATYPKAKASYNGAMKALGYSSDDNRDKWLNYLFDNWSERVDYLAVMEKSLKQLPSVAVERRLRRCIETAPKGKAHAKLLMGFKTYLNNMPDMYATLIANPQIDMQVPKYQQVYMSTPRTAEQNDEAAGFLQTVIEDYADLSYSNSDSMMRTNTFGEAAKNELYELRNLQIGMQAPEIVANDLDGTEFKLSDYRGKVVMLDFWGHWCGPCRALYPRERKLVKELSGLPFALLGVNSDPKLSTAKGAVEKSKLPWRNFWNGPEGPSGPIARQWNVSAWPTIYLVDGEGVIRYKGIRGANLDRGIEKLLSEIGQEVSLTTGEEYAIKK